MENIFVSLATGFWQVVKPLLNILSPLLIGLIIAYLLHPIADRLRSKLGDFWAIFFTYLGVFILLIGFIGSFIVLILGALPTGSWQETARSITAYFEDAYQSAVSFLSRYLPGDLSAPEDGASQLLNWLSSRFSLPAVTHMAQSLAGSLVNLFLGVVASVYLLKDKDFFLRLWQQFLSLILKQKTHGLISETMGEINVVVTTFLKGAFIDSLLVALLSSLALSLLHLDYAVVIGVLGGILNIIPYFGPFFGMVPAFLVGLFTSGPAKAFLSVVALFLVQQIDGNFIYPKVVGSATGLHPLFVLLSVSIFGHFFGIIGMILAVPVAGILQILIRKWAYR
ncbi:MAG: AI-2E family transporter [Firmicutes bacterium]|jgi:predicted PurR-regulated permease PerM|nr:AI-2E family transporter [Bacillota bacterium]